MNSNLKFDCIRCGQCCKWHGYVRLSEKEADDIANFLGMELADFFENMIILTADRRGISLVENEDGSCPFYVDSPRGCKIYECRPSQCRDYPHKWHNPGKTCPGVQVV